MLSYPKGILTRPLPQKPKLEDYTRRLEALFIHHNVRFDRVCSFLCGQGPDLEGARDDARQLLHAMLDGEAVFRAFQNCILDGIEKTDSLAGLLKKIEDLLPLPFQQGDKPQGRRSDWTPSRFVLLYYLTSNECAKRALNQQNKQDRLKALKIIANKFLYGEHSDSPSEATLDERYHEAESRLNKCAEGFSHEDALLAVKRLWHIAGQLISKDKDNDLIKVMIDTDPNWCTCLYLMLQVSPPDMIPGETN